MLGELSDQTPISWLRLARLRAGRLLRRLRKTDRVRDDWEPAGGSVIALAPHPDDEIVGCGGTLLRHVQAGDAVSTVYLTRGELSVGYHWLTTDQRAAYRTREALAGSRVLGIKSAEFLPDRNPALDAQQPDPETIAELAKILKRLNPRVIYLPHAQDQHPDHLLAWRTATAAFTSFGKPISAVYQYEVWSPLDADYVVDVTRQMSRKLRALRRHRLALDAFDYVTTTKSLASYRCRTLLNHSGYAEAYKRLDVASMASGQSEELSAAPSSGAHGP